jgi:hypothetical protein
LGGGGVEFGLTLNLKFKSFEEVVDYPPFERVVEIVNHPPLIEVFDLHIPLAMSN